jgi:hypothetical protein
MMYAMVYGHLPFFSDDDEEFIDKIINQAIKFDTDIPVTQECVLMMKGMLEKDPEKRMLLLDVMNLNYFMIDEEEVEELIKQRES